MGARYRFVLARAGAAKPGVITSASQDPNADIARRDEYPGLVYRRPEPYSFQVYKEEEGTDAVRFVGSVDVSLPNLAPLERMAFPELAITTRDGVAFRDGMPVAATGLPPRKRHRITIHFESGNGDDKKRAAEASAPQAPASAPPPGQHTSDEG
jgi:hypothetical protein